MPADDRLTAQIELITSNLEGAAAFPADWPERGFVEYLYRQQTVLTRAADADRVTRAVVQHLNAQTDQVGTVGRRESTVDGLVSIDLSPHPGALRPRGTVPAVLDALDAELGLGVARPDTVLYVASHPCPAKEPEPAPGGTTRPYPDPNDTPGCGCTGAEGGCGSDHCHGEGVAVTVADLGLHKGSLTGHDWLDGVDGEAEDPFLPNGEIRPYGFHGLFGAGNVRVTAPKATVFVEQDVELAAASSGATYETDATLKLDTALQGGAPIVVFVFTASTREQLSLLGFDVLYENRIKSRTDLVFLAPAGNEGQPFRQYPAAYDWAISVGALTKDGSGLASFSNYGSWVDVFAPGEDLVNAFGTGTYTYTEPPNRGTQQAFTGMASWSGTSFSTPLVAGLIATRMSCKNVSAPDAARALLDFARTQQIAEVGPVLLPGQACCSS